MRRVVFILMVLLPTVTSHAAEYLLKDDYVPPPTFEVGVPWTYAVSNNTPSGFPSHDQTSLALIENVGGVNDTFAVVLSGVAFPVYVKGRRQYKSSQTITQAGAQSKRYFVFYDLEGTLSISDTEWQLDPGDYDGRAPICTVLWDATAHQGILEEERHHSWRDIHFHHWGHHTVGPRYSAAHNANGLNLANPGADQYATFSVSAGEIYDEDIPNNIDGHTNCALFYHAADGTMTWETSVVPYKAIAGVPQYDNGTGLAAKGASNTQGYFVSWMYATNVYRDGTYTEPQIAVVIHQDTNATTTLTEAQNAAPPSLPTGFVLEWKLVWKMIFRYGAGPSLTWVSNTDYRQAGTLPQGQVQSTNIAANAVSFSPPATMTAANVQAAIEELLALIQSYHP